MRLKILISSLPSTHASRSQVFAIAFFLMLALLIPASSHAGPMVFWCSRSGIQGRDTLNNVNSGYLLNITNLDWTPHGIAALPHSDRLIVYTTTKPLQLWDAIENRRVGELKRSGTSWQGLEIAFDPEVETRVVYTSRSGLKVWDLSTGTDVGTYKTVASGSWSGAGIEFIPGNFSQIIYGDANGIYLWNTAANVLVGRYERDTSTGWNTGICFAPKEAEASSTYPIVLGMTASQSVKAGANAEFRVHVSGAEPITYQWFLNDRALEGETRTNLVLQGVSGRDRGHVTVEISNAYASYSSQRAALVVDGVDLSIHSAVDMDWPSEPGKYYRLEGVSGLTTQQLLPAGTPMFLKKGQNSPWEVVANASGWMQGSGEIMRVIFGVWPVPHGFFRVAETNNRPVGP